MTKKKATQKTRREKKKLSHTVMTLASMIDTIATGMKGEVERGEEFDLKQLKELTGAAKELSALISATDPTEGAEEDERGIAVIFRGEGQEWAE